MIAIANDVISLHIRTAGNRFVQVLAHSIGRPTRANLHGQHLDV